MNENTPLNQSKESHGQFIDRLMLGRWQPIIWLGILYGAGFVVLSTFGARYGLPSPSSLEPRHFAAGALFFACAVVPFFAPMFCDEVMHRCIHAWGAAGMKELTQRIVGKSIYIVLLIAIGFVWIELIAATSVYEERETILGFVIGTTAIGHMLSEGLLVGKIRSTAPSKWESFRLWFDTIVFIPLFAIVFLILLWVFGSSVYPNLPAEYGGGSVPLVRLTFKDSTPSPIATADFERVALLDRRDGTVSLLACAKAQVGPPILFTVADDMIRSIVYETSYDTITKLKTTRVSLRSKLCSEPNRLISEGDRDVSGRSF